MCLSACVYVQLCTCECVRHNVHTHTAHVHLHVYIHICTCLSEGGHIDMILQVKVLKTKCSVFNSLA